MQFSQNEIVVLRTDTHTYQMHRILYIDYPQKQICSINMKKKKKVMPSWKPQKFWEMKLKHRDAQIIPNDPWAWLHQPDEFITESHCTFRDNAYAVIADMVENHFYEALHSKPRGKFMTKLAITSGKSRSTCEKIFQRYCKRGLAPNALRPDYYNCGAPGKLRITVKNSDSKIKKKLGSPKISFRHGIGDPGINIDSTHRNIIRHSYENFVKNQSMSYPAAYLQMLMIFYFCKPDPENPKKLIPVDKAISPHFHDWEIKPEAPSIHQFRYWCKKFKEQEAKTKNSREDINNRDIDGRSADTADWPTKRYQVDAWLIDQYVVDPQDRSNILGRPIMYLVVDVYSHMPVGLHITLLPPSWDSVKIALYNAMTSKIDYCAKFGIHDIDESIWPAAHVPVEIYADRGETDTKKAEEMIEGLNIRLINGPAYTPYLRGLVESMFHVFKINLVGPIPESVNEKLKNQPRGHRKDVRINALLTPDELTRLAIRKIFKLIHYHHVGAGNEREKAMLEDGIGSTPVDLWHWGIQNKAGGIRKRSSDEIKLCLLPRHRISVTRREGIHLIHGKGKGLRYIPFTHLDDDTNINRYTCDNTKLAYIRDNFSGKKLQVAYNNSLIDEIYLILKDGVEIVPLRLHKNSKAFTGLSFNEYKFVREIIKIREEFLLKKIITSKVRFLKTITEVVSTAKEAAAQSREGKTDKEILEGVRKNLKNAREIERKQNILRIGGGEQIFTDYPDHEDVEKSDLVLLNSENSEYVSSGNLEDLLE